MSFTNKIIKLTTAWLLVIILIFGIAPNLGLHVSSRSNNSNSPYKSQTTYEPHTDITPLSTESDTGATSRFNIQLTNPIGLVQNIIGLATATIPYDTSYITVDIATHQGMTWQLYSDAAGLFPISPTLQLDIGDNRAFIRVTDDNGQFRIFTLMVTREGDIPPVVTTIVWQGNFTYTSTKQKKTVQLLKLYSYSIQLTDTKVYTATQN